MKHLRFLLLLACAGVALSQAARPNFNGTWKFDAAKSTLKHSKVAEHTWKIEAIRDKIQFAETSKDDGKETSRTWECSTKGQECQVDDAGTQCKVSMFYNGDALMEFRTRGEDISRRSYKLAEDGKTLEVEITYIAPQKDTEKLVLAKVQ
jgi:hypothetical protein